MVVTLELEDHLATRRRADEADRRLRRLGTGCRVAKLLDPGTSSVTSSADLAGEPVREGDVDTGARDGLLHRVPDEGGMVAEQVDAVAAAVVEVLVAVGIADARTGGRTRSRDASPRGAVRSSTRRPQPCG